MADSIICWHFAGEAYRDGSPLLPAGKPLPELSGTEPGEPGMYHGSVRGADALAWATGSMVARVRLYQNVTPQDGDKYAAQRRVGLTDYYDATDVLRDHARWCARRVSHLENFSPDMLRWLYTGDESVRQLAWESERDSAWVSAWESTWEEPAWSSARASERGPTWASAWEGMSRVLHWRLMDLTGASE